MTLRHGQQVESPRCAYTAGVLVGFVNVITDRQDVVCIEHRCQARYILSTPDANVKLAVMLRPSDGMRNAVWHWTPGLWETRSVS